MPPCMPSWGHGRNSRFHFVEMPCGNKLGHVCRILGLFVCGKVGHATIPTGGPWKVFAVSSWGHQIHLQAFAMQCNLQVLLQALGAKNGFGNCFYLLLCMAEVSTGHVLQRETACALRGAEVKQFSPPPPTPCSCPHPNHGLFVPSSISWTAASAGREGCAGL
jgi:hypothetical protein